METSKKDTIFKPGDVVKMANIPNLEHNSLWKEYYKKAIGIIIREEKDLSIVSPMTNRDCYHKIFKVLWNMKDPVEKTYIDCVSGYALRKVDSSKTEKRIN